MKALSPRAMVAAALGVLLGCEGDTLVAPSLEASCGASPAAGTAPLLVRFTLNVAGAAGPFSVAVAYGDGEAGRDPDQPHTYVTPGAYTAAFTVTTETQSARCSVAVEVSPLPLTVEPIENTPPVAVFQTTPAARPGDRIEGPAPLAVRFNMCASSDVDRDVLRFTMDFEGDGSNEVDGTTGGACRRDHTYAAGAYRPRVCVTDLRRDGSPAHPFQCRVYGLTAGP